MEHPVSGTSGFSTHREAPMKKATLVHGGISLQLSEGGESPLLEAHPGSPVDLTARRTTLATTMASQRLYHGSQEGKFSRFGKSPNQLGKKEEVINRDGVVVKGQSSIEYRSEMNENEFVVSPKTKMQVSSVQPFYSPAKIPEQEEVLHAPSPDDQMSIDTATEQTAMDFHFEEENGIWISAIPVARESRTSIATLATATSTLVDERPGNGAMTIDTSVASSSASMISLATCSQPSAVTNSDIYGWEEELDRQMSVEDHSVEDHNVFERDIVRRLPTGFRAVVPRARGGYSSKRPDGKKKKSLLHRVLNLSGSRERWESDGVGVGTMGPTN